MPEAIEVIIPTMCDSKRGPLLLRAIDSVVSQEGVAALPVVIVNGARVDPSFLAQLARRSDIRLIQRTEPSLFKARRAGFESIRAQFFAILDDDDIFLPGALAKRLDALRADDTADWVVTNGIFVMPDGDVPYIPDVEAVRRDPMGTLLDHCWLCSAGNLFRKSAVAPDIFDTTLSMDLTYIAFRLLAEGKKVRFLDDSTFKYFYYPDSTSKQHSYNRHAAAAIQAMMRLNLPGRVRQGLASKYRRAMHDAASHHFVHGQMREAWAAHLRSLAGLPEFFRFAAFTRKLLVGPRGNGASQAAD
jgi:glycosyltransferase involved in cell wall biosynthesis